MGDTIIPVKQFIIREQQNLHYFRGALLPEYRRALDDLFVHAEHLSAAITMAEHLPRSEALLLSLILGERVDSIRLENEIHRLETLVKSLTGPKE
jgi:hypothetical protein